MRLGQIFIAAALALTLGGAASASSAPAIQLGEVQFDWSKNKGGKGFKAGKFKGPKFKRSKGYRAFGYGRPRSYRPRRYHPGRYGGPRSYRARYYRPRYGGR